MEYDNKVDRLKKVCASYLLASMAPSHDTRSAGWIAPVAVTVHQVPPTSVKLPAKLLSHHLRSYFRTFELPSSLSTHSTSMLRHH